MLDRLVVLLFRLLTSFALVPFLCALVSSTVVLCHWLDFSIPVTLSAIHEFTAAFKECHSEPERVDNHKPFISIPCSMNGVDLSHKPISD